MLIGGTTEARNQLEADCLVIYKGVAVHGEELKLVIALLQVPVVVRAGIYPGKSASLSLWHNWTRTLRSSPNNCGLQGFLQTANRFRSLSRKFFLWGYSRLISSSCILLYCDLDKPVEFIQGGFISLGQEGLRKENPCFFLNSN